MVQVMVAVITANAIAFGNSVIFGRADFIVILKPLFC